MIGMQHKDVVVPKKTPRKVAMKNMTRLLQEKYNAFVTLKRFKALLEKE
jgi:hypothetical protein